MTKQITVNLDKKLERNNNVWIVGFNPVNNSAKVLLSSGEVVEIPKDSYIDIRDYLNSRRHSYKVWEVAN